MSNQRQHAGIAPPPGFYGTRSRAFEFRDQIERLLDDGNERVAISFSGVSATQSFIDELLGVLIIERGAEVAGRLAFRDCSDETKSIIRFVLNDRLDQLDEMAERHLA